MSFAARYPTALLGEMPLSAREGRSLDKEKRKALKCPRCHDRVTPVRIDGGFYYRHYVEPSGQSRCVRPKGESAIHRDAKFLLLNVLHQLIRDDCGMLPVSVDCPSCGVAEKGEVYVELRPDDQVDVEVRIPDADAVADVAVIRGGVPVVVFEVWATHRVDDPKWMRLSAQRELTCVEVDAYEVLPKGGPRWSPPRALPATNSSPAIEPCEACRSPPAPVRPLLSCPREQREERGTAAAPLLHVEVPDFAADALLTSAPSAPSAGHPAEKRRPPPILDDTRPPSPAAPAQVMDYQMPDGGPVRYRLHEPRDQYEALIRTVPTRAELEALCLRRGYVLAAAPSFLGLQRPRTRRLVRRDDD